MILALALQSWHEESSDRWGWGRQIATCFIQYLDTTTTGWCQQSIAKQAARVPSSERFRIQGLSTTFAKTFQGPF